MSLTRRDERNRESGCVYGEKEKRKEEDVKQEKKLNTQALREACLLKYKACLCVNA